MLKRVVSILLVVFTLTGVLPTNILYDDLFSINASAAVLTENEYISQHVDFINSGKPVVQIQNQGFYNSIWQYEEESPNFTVYSAWEIVGDVGELVTLNFNDLFLSQNPYDIILTDILSSYITDMSFVNTCEKTLENLFNVDDVYDKILKVLRTSKEWDDSMEIKISQTLKNLVASCGSSLIDGVLFSTKDYNLKNKNPGVYEILVKLIPSVSDNSWNDLFKKLENTSAIIGYIKTGSDVVFDFFDAYQKYLIAEVLVNNNDELIGVLINASYEMPPNACQLMMDSIFKFLDGADCDSICKFFLEDSIINVYELFRDGLTKLIYNGLSCVLGVPVGTIGSIVFTYNTTYSLLDYFTGLGEQSKLFFLMNAGAMLEESLVNSNKEYSNTLINYPTLENAKNYDASWTFIQSLESYLYKCLSGYLSAIKKAYGFEFVVKTALHKGDFVNFVFSYIKMNKNNSDADCGIKAAAQLECEWKNTSCHNGTLISSKVVSVKCPTDIYVYDPLGNIVLSIISNSIEVCSQQIAVVVDGDEKTFVLPCDQVYDVRIVATDNGEMDYEIFEVAENSVKRFVTYENVPLTLDCEYTSAIDTKVNTSVEIYNLVSGDLIVEATFDSLPQMDTEITDIIVSEELFEGFSTELIDKVANAMFKFEPVVDITSYNISTNDTVALFSAISKYYPTEYGLLTKSDFKYKIIFSPSLGRITDIRFYYGDDANLEAFEQRNKDLKAEIDKIVAQVKGMDDFEKALYIHDYIVLNSEYDLELLKILKTEGTLTGELRSEKYTEYSILINGTGICGSYALAYRALLNAAGVDCLYLSSQQMNHAWNMAKIDGEWYHVDCCWDDPVPDTYGVSRRTYFLRTDEEIMELNHYSWIPGTYKATSTLYSDMPRYADDIQKYDNGKWYCLISKNLLSFDRYGNNKELIGTINATSIDVDNDTIYFSSGRYIHEYANDESSIVYALSNLDIGKQPELANIFNFYINDNFLTYYKSIYDESNKRVVVNGSDIIEKEKYSSITGIDISKTELIMDVFDTFTLSSTVINSGGTAYVDDIWYSSDENIASVNQDGRITANNIGTATITVEMLGYKANCIVTVSGDGLSGNCGDNIAWVFDNETGCLSISGTGKMLDYSNPSSLPPWYSLRTKILSVDVQNGIEYIGSTSFLNCIYLKKICISDDVKIIGSSAFSHCESVESIILPKGLVNIGSSAFSYCLSLKEIVLPNSVTDIDNSAFAYCAGLEKVTIPEGVITLKGSAFYACESLEYISIPSSVNEIGSSAFSDCKRIKNVMIKDGVEKIGSCAFKGCTLLESIAIPKSIVSIATGGVDWAFRDCPSLKEIKVDVNNLNYIISDGVLFNRDMTELICYCPKLDNGLSYIVPKEVVEIHSYAFQNNSTLKSITIQEGVTDLLCGYAFDKAVVEEINLPFSLTQINNNTFYFCENLKSIKLPDGLTGIGNSAFYNCKSLEYVNIPENVSLIGKETFWGCDSLIKIDVSETNQYYTSTENALYNKNKTELIKAFAGSDCTRMTIPDTVESIYLGAFDGCKNLTYIYIPALADIVLKSSGNAMIERGFANDATNLKEIEVSNENTKFKSINGVLYNKGGTKLIKYPSNKADKIFTVPDTVTNIASYSFMSSRNLSTVYLNDNINAIGSFAFKNCDRIRTIKVPYGIRLVNLSAFSDCDNLEALIIDYYLEYEPWLINTMNYGVTYLNFNCDKTLIKGSASFQPTYLESIYCSTFYCERVSQIPEQCNWINTSEIKPDHKHDYILNDYVEPTESYDGYEYWECYCGEDGYKISLHNYDESIIQHSTCTEDGYKSAQCKNCKETSFLERIPALGHNYKVVSSTPGSCTTAPTETFTCSICQDTYTETGSTDSYHSYTETVTAPTCTEIGYITATCEHCGENAMYDFVPMLGHDVTVTHTDADCKKCAQTEYSCSRCDYHEIIVDEESDLGEHKISVTVTEATCVENGSINKVCVTCNELISSEVIASNGHVPSEWKTVDDATTELAGKKEQRCDVCSELLAEEEIPKIPVNVSDVELSESEIEIVNKSTYRLNANISPDNADDQSVTWTSDDESIASVDENGVVTAVSLGKANITVTTTDGGFTAVCAVTVIPREFNVIWIVDGEKKVESFKEESTITEPETPQKKGYSLVGWTPEIPDTMPTYDLEFTAIWSVNSYDAVFNANGGKWSDGAVEKMVSTEFDSQIVAPDEPEKQGYIFSGWAPEVGVMDAVNGKKFNAVWVASTDTTYTVETYAMNTLGEYEKTVKTFKGTTNSTVDAEYEIESGFTLNKEKSILSGTVAADNSLVLKVYLDRKTYSFTTVVDGVSETTEYFYGSIIVEPAVPSKIGHKFTGWGKKIPLTMPAEDITVEAEWKVNSYTVTWNVDGTETKTSVEYGAEIEIPVTPSKSGYEFIGWDNQIPDIMPANDLAFKARFSCIASVLIKNNPGKKTIKYGETLRLTAITSNMPADAKVYWYVDGIKKGEGETFNVSFENGTKTVEVKLVDSNGNVLKDSSDTEISDFEEVTVKSGFFQKIISFFKNLFGMNRTVVQAFKGII